MIYNFRIVRLTYLLALSIAAGSLAGAADNTVIDVNLKKQSAEAIPRTIFGTFLEPIGDSTYNGLWAELLENPSFEDNLWSAGAIVKMLKSRPELEQSSNIGLPLPWQALHPDQGWRYEPRWRDTANSNRSLFIMALPTGETGVRQRVYLPAQRVQQYRGSLYARVVSGPPEVKVSLRRNGKDDEIFSEASFKVDADWQKYEFLLSVKPGRLARLEPADFVVSVSNDARVLVDEASLLPADAVDGMDPEMVKMARAMNTPLVRFGGNYTSGYHWSDGVGPNDRRLSMLNQSWQMPEYNQFGTDEFLKFCDLIKARPQIALNLGSGTPHEAADWVKYVDLKYGDHNGGLTWELGNELWGNFQIGYPTIDEVAARTKANSEAIRKVDPNANLIGTGADCDHFEKWNAAQLEGAPGAYSYLSTHFVDRPDTVKTDATPEFVADASFALPIGIERRLQLMKQQIDADPQARGKVRIAFTEWLFVGEGQRVPHYANMGGAIDTAGFLNMLIRNAEFVPISDMTGLIWFGGIWKKMGQVYGVPAYWAFRMYANADLARRVEVSTNSATYDVHEGNKRIPEIPNVPYLDVVAGVNATGNKVTLFCVNRKRDGETRASLHLAGFVPAKTARAQQLSASDIYAVNDEARPEAVIPKALTVKLDSVVFPPASVTVIEVSGK